ncbi:uncharacterized protein DS421_12g370200 [Arachis hypogaea]|nr:uncharacterized protein DS421_12g370200 [Arachis hypogaea]
MDWLLVKYIKFMNTFGKQWILYRIIKRSCYSKSEAAVNVRSQNFDILRILCS